MCRDKFKDGEHFNRFIETKYRLILKRNTYFDNEELPVDKRESNHSAILNMLLQIAIARYSKGESIEQVKESFQAVLTYIIKNDCWIPSINKVCDRYGVLSDQYKVDEHGVMLRMLSLALLLKVSKVELDILRGLIDRDNIVDNLYEFILRCRYPERKQVNKEIYCVDVSVILKTYQKLRSAIICNADLEQAKNEAQELVLGFLKKGFYHRHTGFYCNHKKDLPTHYGYWSFEAAAITCIMDLDDSSYRKHKYYPAELVDYYRSN